MYTVLNVFCSMSTLSTQVCMECNKFNCIHVDTVNTCIFSHLYSGCWTQDGDRGRTCEEVGPGELPQLLRQLKSVTTPTPASPGPSTPVKTEPMEEEEEIEQLADLQHLDLNSLRHP